MGKMLVVVQIHRETAPLCRTITESHLMCFEVTSMDVESWAFHQKGFQHSPKDSGQIFSKAFDGIYKRVSAVLVAVRSNFCS